MPTDETHETVHRHATIVVAGSRTGDPGRKGEILEVLGTAGHPHYLVRWEDGHETLFFPAGNARILHPMAEALAKTLAEQGVPIDLLPHEHSETAGAEARALGVTPDQVAKTVVIRTATGYVRVVVPASERVDLQKVRGLLGGNGDTRLATESELAAAYPEFELGAVPPLGGPSGDTVLVDETLTDHDRVVFEAGTHDESIRMETKDLLKLTDARIGDVSEV
jgi:Ala-tRNA(Pro) deacylase